MTRISLTEQYDDRDVIAQIVRLKDGLEDISGGVIADIQIVGNDLVIQWADGSSVTLPLPDPVTGISSVTGSVSGGNLTITFYFTNGTTHSFTCPLSGMATEAYVDAGLALKADDSSVVKLTGDQNIANVKNFTGEARVVTTPSSYLDAVNAAYVNNANSTVNNIVHKDGTGETITSAKTFTSTITSRRTAADQYQLINLTRNENIPTRDTAPASEMIFFDGLVGDTDGLSIATVNRCISPTERYQVFALRNMRNGQAMSFGVHANSTEDYGTSPYRTVDPNSNVYDGDVVTVGTLKALKAAGWFS